MVDKDNEKDGEKSNRKNFYKITRKRLKVEARTLPS